MVTDISESDMQQQQAYGNGYDLKINPIKHEKVEEDIASSMSSNS